ncbi:MAG TPA: type II secretion system protein GspN [Polyangiaceae bacterium]|nr:type II secretion system protein GspN [Polyangiaceae bacterium]
MNPRLRNALRWTGYPLFYLACLVAFSYVSVPWDRLKGALSSGFNQSSPLRMDIEKLTWAFRFPGVVAKNVKFTGTSPGMDEKGKPRPAPEYQVDELFARVSVFPLLWGTTKMSYSIDGFGGSIDGSVKTSSDGRELDVEFDDVDAAKVPFVSDLLGIPIGGTLNGKVELKLPQDKLTMAEGSIDLKIADFTIADGKTKIRDMIALPKVRAGDFVMKADVTEGTLKITELTTKGQDLEVVSEGRIRLMDRFDASLVEQNLRFKFSDAYKGKDETTKSIFGAPGSTVPGLFDLDPKMKRAKREDGFYAWHITGPMMRLNFAPATNSGADAAAAARARRTNLKGFAQKKVDAPAVPPPPAAPPPAAPTPDENSGDTPIPPDTPAPPAP